MYMLLHEGKHPYYNKGDDYVTFERKIDMQKIK